MLIKIFLSYAREDQLTVASIRESLKTLPSLIPWMDIEDIPGGVKWSLEIENAIADSDLVVVCLSTQSVNKQGFIQEELKIALRYWEEKKGLDTDFLIPLRLDECEIPEKLRSIQAIDFFAPQGLENLLTAIKHATYAHLQKMSIQPPVKPRSTPNKTMKRVPPINWRAAEALGIVNFVEQLEDDWGPTGCGERTRRSLKIAGLQGSKWVDDEKTFEDFKDCLTRLSRIQESSVKFLLINPLSKVLPEIRRATRAAHDFAHDYRILARYHQLTELYSLFKVRLYEHFPYFRIVVIDEAQMAVSRYHISKDRKEGWRAPHLILKNDEQPGRAEASSLFYAFERHFEQIWGDECLSKPIDQIMIEMDARLNNPEN